MKKIQLGGRKGSNIRGYALVDDEDFEELNNVKWYALWNPHTKTFYAVRNIRVRNGKRTMISMHRIIMNTPKGMDTDHQDGDGLNNQRTNLRVCTNAQNNQNKSKYSNNITGFKGVVLHKEAKKFQAQIFVNRKHINLGLFNSLKKAALAYNEAAKKYHGEFANLNPL